MADEPGRCPQIIRVTPDPRRPRGWTTARATTDPIVTFGRQCVLPAGHIGALDKHHFELPNGRQLRLYFIP